MPATSPDITLVEVLPVMAPGLIVQLPEGNPVSSTLPVDDEQLV